MTVPLTPIENTVIDMAWDDTVSFDMIKAQTGLDEGEVIRLMRRALKPGSFRVWRARVSGRAAKHAVKGSAVRPTTGQRPAEDATPSGPEESRTPDL